MGNEQHSVRLWWASDQTIKVGGQLLSSQSREKALNNVNFYPFDVVSSARNQQVAHPKEHILLSRDLPVTWEDNSAMVDLPPGLMVILTLPFGLIKILQDIHLIESRHSFASYEFGVAVLNDGGAIIDHKYYQPGNKVFGNDYGSMHVM